VVVGVIPLELPWPPSDNHAIRHVAGDNKHRHYRSHQYKTFLREVAKIVLVARVKPLLGRLRVTVHASAPDRRQRDITNLWKCLNDALQHAGVFRNDSQIDDARILRTKGIPGTVTVFIEEMRDATQARDEQEGAPRKHQARDRRREAA
jgi:crossover junction endodeoxyribonuclease RusA